MTMLNMPNDQEIRNFVSTICEFGLTTYQQIVRQYPDNVFAQLRAYCYAPIEYINEYLRDYEKKLLLISNKDALIQQYLYSENIVSRDNARLFELGGKIQSFTSELNRIASEEQIQPEPKSYQLLHPFVNKKAKMIALQEKIATLKKLSDQLVNSHEYTESRDFQVELGTTYGVWTAEQLIEKIAMLENEIAEQHFLYQELNALAHNGDMSFKTINHFLRVVVRMKKQDESFYIVDLSDWTNAVKAESSIEISSRETMSIDTCFCLGDYVLSEAEAQNIVNQYQCPSIWRAKDYDQYLNMVSSVTKISK